MASRTFEMSSSPRKTLSPSLPENREGTSGTSCLICTTSVAEDSKSLSNIFPNLKSFSMQEMDVGCLNSHLCSIFILRKLLQFPTELCEKLLEETGMDPGGWFSVCGSCSESVRQALEIYVMILELNSYFEKIQGGLQNLLRSSLGYGSSLYERMRKELCSDSRGDHVNAELIVKVEKERHPEEESSPPAIDDLEWIKQENSDEEHNLIYEEYSSRRKTRGDGDSDEDSVRKPSGANNKDSDFNVSDEDVCNSSERASMDDDDDDFAVGKFSMGASRQNRKKHYACHLCKFVGTSVKSRAAHMRKKHPSEKKQRNRLLSHHKRTDAELDEIKQESTDCDLNNKERGDDNDDRCDVKVFSSNASNEKQNRRLTYSCNWCDYVGKSVKLRLKHCLLKHPTEMEQRPLNCDKCDFVGNVPGDMARHRRRHLVIDNFEYLNGTDDSRRARCKLCGFESTIPKMYAHLRNVHSLDSRPPFLQKASQPTKSYVGATCHLCNRTFTRQTTLRNHILSVHEKVKRFVCEHCGRGFFQRPSYRDHLLAHTDPKHVSSSGVGRPFPCKICGATFTGRSCRVKHMKTYHKSVSQTATNSSVDQQQVVFKKYKCSLCDYEAPYPMALNQHLKTVHEDAFKYKCDLCVGAMFRTRDGLRCHNLKVHAPKVPCPHCSTLIGSGSLKNHMKSATCQRKRQKIISTSANIDGRAGDEQATE